TLLTALPSTGRTAMAAKAMKTSRRAYSTRSWPDSSFRKSFTIAVVNLNIGLDSRNAGPRMLIPSGAVNDGNSGLNYAVTPVNVAGSITPRPLTVSAMGMNKFYDGTVAAAVTLSDNRLLGDVFTDAYSTATFANANVGTWTVSVNGI